MSDWVLSERLLIRWRRLVAFMKAMDLPHRTMCPLKYRRTTTAIEMANKAGGICIIVLFAVALAAAGAIRSE
jgi:hypothetical protein